MAKKRTREKLIQEAGDLYDELVSTINSPWADKSEEQTECIEILMQALEDNYNPFWIKGKISEKVRGQGNAKQKTHTIIMAKPWKN